MDGIILLKCPNCGNFFITAENDINCAIYRHAALKSNMEQIDPHMSKDDCDKLIKEGLVYGCAKPFKIIKKESLDFPYEAVKCDYI